MNALYHRRSLRHIVDAIRGICPCLYDNGGTGGQVQLANLSLHPLVFQTNLFNRFHIRRINIWVFARKVLLADYSILVQVDQELHELARTNTIRDRDLDPGNTGRTSPDRLSPVLALQKRDHFIFEWFPEGDHPKAGILAGEERANHSCGLRKDVNLGIPWLAWRAYL